MIKETAADLQYTPNVFSTLTQWKFLWFTNFYYLAVSQNIHSPVSSLLIGGVLEEGTAQTCEDDITSSLIFHFMKRTANIHNL